MKLFLPLSHNTKPCHWRVPVYRQDEQHQTLYTIKLDMDYTRVFTEQSLPDYIKTKIVIADAGYEPKELQPAVIEAVDVFLYRGSFGLQDTAWRYDNNHYIVVLNNVEFNTLKGIENGDTRSESESES